MTTRILQKNQELIDEFDKTKTLNLHRVRVELEDPIYDVLRERYGKVYAEFWNQVTLPKHASNTILLVERRPHPNLEFVLQNAVYYCSKSGKPFSLTVVCSDVNMEFVKCILGKHVETTTLIPYFTGLGTYDDARNEYNLAFKSKAFWEQIQADYILSIQTDSYLLRPLPDIFWTYDYIASPWLWKPGFVGGGGLTWRKKDVVLRILDHLGNITFFENEDCYFSQGLAELDCNIPEYEESKQYFVESCFTDSPIGVHQWWTFWFSIQNQEDKQKYMERYLDLE